MRQAGQTLLVTVARGFAKFAWVGEAPLYPILLANSNPCIISLLRDRLGGEDYVIRVQFGQALPLTIMDQIVGVLSMSRWSSNEGASARAGAKHYEPW